MNADELHDAAGLMRDVERYLAAVEAFRAEGYPPSWDAEPQLPEPAPPPVVVGAR